MIPLWIAFVFVSTSVAELVPPGQQCTYKYESKQVMGIPRLHSQYTGLGQRARLVVTALPNQQLALQLQRVEHGEMEHQVIRSSSYRDVNISYQAVDPEKATTLQQPFIVQLGRGNKVESLTVDQNEPTWSVNIKKAVAQLIQLDLTGETSQPVRQQQFFYRQSANPNKATYFNVSEKTIGGTCQTQYQLSPPLRDLQKADMVDHIRHACPEAKWPIDPMKTPVRVLHKIRNYAKCQDRPEWQHMMPSAIECNAEDCYMTASNRSAVTRYVVIGDLQHYSIRHIDAEETKAIYPEQTRTQSPILVHTRQTLYQLECRKIQSPPPKIPTPIKQHNLTFQYPTLNGQSPYYVDQTSPPPVSPYMPGANFTLDSSQIISSIVEMIQRIEKNIRQPNPDRDTDVTAVIIEAQRAISLLGYDHIRSLTSRLQSQVQKNLFCAIAPTAGTNPVIKFIADTAQHRSFCPAQVDMMLQVIPTHIKTPTATTVGQLFHLLKSNAPEMPQSTKWALSQTIGQVLHSVCVNNNTRYYSYPTNFYGQFCNNEMRQLMNEFINTMVEEIANAPEPEKAAYIQAVGNTGHVKAVEVLFKVIDHNSVPPTVTKAIYALQRVSNHNRHLRPRIIAKLLATFLATNNPTKVRKAAFISLIGQDPPEDVIQQLAVHTHYEPSQQIQTLTYGTFRSLASKQYAQFRQLHSIGRKAAAAMSLIKPSTRALLFSTKHYLSQIASRTESGYSVTGGGLFNIFNVFPDTLYARLSNFRDGHLYNVLKSSLSIEGVKLFEFFEKPFELHRANSNTPPVPQQVHDILQQLKVHNKKLENVPAYLSLFSEIGVMSSYWASNISWANFSFPQNQPYHMKNNTQTVFYTEDKIETVSSLTGFPITVTKLSPYVLSSEREIEIKNQSAEGYYQFKIQNKHASIESKSRVMVSTVSPFTSKILGTSLDSTARIYLPWTELAFSLNLQNKIVEASVALKETNPVPLVVIKQTPFTRAAPVEKPSYRLPSAENKPIEPDQQPEITLPLSSGQYLKTELTVKRYPASFQALYAWYERRVGRSSAPPSYKYNTPSKFQLTIKPSESNSRQIAAVFTLVNSSQSIPPSPPASKSVVPSHIYQQAIQESREVQQRLRQMPKAANFSTAVSIAISVYSAEGSSPVSQLRSHVLSAYVPYNQTEYFETHVDTNSMRMCAQGVLQPPQTSGERQEILNRPSVTPVKGEVSWGSQSCSERSVSFQGQFETDARGKAIAQHSPQAQRCEQHEAHGHPSSWDCEIAKDQAAYPSKIQLRFKQRGLEQQHLEALNAVSSYVKSQLYYYVNEYPFKHNTPNQVDVTVHVDPMRKRMNVSVDQPSESIRLMQVPLVKPFDKVTMRRSPMEQVSNALFSSSRCHVNERFVETFDNVSIALNDSCAQCHTLMAAYYRSRANYLTVLTKPQPNGRKELLVLVDGNQVEVKPVGSNQYAVKVNGGPVQPVNPTSPVFVADPQSGASSGVYIYSKAGSAVVALTRYMGEVRLHSKTISLYLHPLATNYGMLGLCGNFDRESSYELVDRHMCVRQAPRDFANSYCLKLPGDQCSPPPSPGPSDNCIKTPLESV